MGYTRGNDFSRVRKIHPHERTGLDADAWTDGRWSLMSIDRERFDPQHIREELDDRLDPSTARKRLDAFYERHFLPPSVN